MLPNVTCHVLQEDLASHKEQTNAAGSTPNLQYSQAPDYLCRLTEPENALLDEEAKRLWEDPWQHRTTQGALNAETK